MLTVTVTSRIIRLKVIYRNWRNIVVGIDNNFGECEFLEIAPHYGDCSKLTYYVKGKDLYHLFESRHDNEDNNVPTTNSYSYMKYYWSSNQ